jgi:catechol 2,3-dioxygenase-like lactoylglutathione lyase family enzyme
MIALRRIDHVSLRTPNPVEAARRWSLQFGLVEREPGRLACDDEPFSLELLPGEPGVEHVAYELRASCSLEAAASHVKDYEEVGGGIRVTDPEGNKVLILPNRGPTTWTSHVRPARDRLVGAPRKLGHVNFLTGNIHEQVDFYTRVLGMELTDWLGDGGVWLHINGDHHVMALVDKGYSHFHHLAFDVVDIGQMRDSLDHLARHGRWLGWGPTRHGIGGNIASYVRIVEEECFVELYCDMEQLEAEHTPRTYPDNRYSSNTWGPLPPRSYFRFDADAIAAERESLEMIA